MAGYRLIEDSIERVESEDFFDKIALVAHNCYQVSAKSHEDNVQFVKRLIASGHLAMIEHYRFTVRTTYQNYADLVVKTANPFIHVDCVSHFDSTKNVYFISFSLRPLIEAKPEDRFVYVHLANALPPEIFELLDSYREYPDEHICSMADMSEVIDQLGSERAKAFIYPTYCLITDRGVTHELVRHRIASYAQESTRYCNYSKDKFDNCLTFIKPLKYEECKEEYDAYFQQCSDTYFALLEKGCSPQEARSVLPNCLKTSIMVTCNLDEWDVIFNLRTADNAHPDIRRVISKVRDDMEK